MAAVAAVATAAVAVVAAVAVAVAITIGARCGGCLYPCTCELSTPSSIRALLLKLLPVFPAPRSSYRAASHDCLIPAAPPPLFRHDKRCAKAAAPLVWAVSARVTSAPPHPLPPRGEVATQLVAGSQPVSLAGGAATRLEGDETSRPWQTMAEAVGGISGVEWA